jgi:hypothetical protein
MADEGKLWSTLGTEIVASPGNEELRYQFASDLERDEPEVSPNRARAEFIRVQLKLSRLSANHPEYMRLATRAHRLELQYRGEWIPSGFRQVDVREVEFHRGFVELIRLPASVLREYQNGLFREAPIQHLDVVELQSPDQLRPLLDSLEENGHLQKLVSLRLDGQGLDDESVETLGHAAFERLRWLSLAHNQIGPKGVSLLARERFRNLRFLDLHDNPFDPTPQLVYDQGVVIERRADPRVVEFGAVPWLRKTIRGGQYVAPDRFSLSR